MLSTAKIVKSVLSNLICSQSFEKPEDAFEQLTSKTWVLCLQTGEYGPIAQCIAGVDIAMHDCAPGVFAAFVEISRGTRNKVSTYASGISPATARKTAEVALAAGHDSLKLKIGFDKDTDLKNIKDLRDLLGSDGKLMLMQINHGQWIKLNT